MIKVFIIAVIINIGIIFIKYYITLTMLMIIMIVVIIVIVISGGGRSGSCNSSISGRVQQRLSSSHGVAIDHVEQTEQILTVFKHLVQFAFLAYDIANLLCIRLLSEAASTFGVQFSAKLSNCPR